MLTDLSFLEPGKTFVPEEEQDRLKNYELYRKLSRNEHQYYYDEHTKTIKEERKIPDNLDDPVFEIYLNLYNVVSSTWKSLLFFEKPEIKGQNEQENEYIKTLIRKNKLWKKAKDICYDVSRFGNGVFKVWFSSELNRAVIGIVKPDIWFPVVYENDVSEVRYQVIAFKFKHDDDEYLQVEIHEPGKIYNRLYSLSNNQIKEQLPVDTFNKDLLDEVNTGIDEFLVIPVDNSTTSDSIYGDSDYEDINSIIYQLEKLVTKFSNDLKEQGNILVTTPDQQARADENDGKFDVSGGIIYTKDPNQTKKLTWEMHHESFAATINELMRFFYILSRLNPALISQFKTGVSDGNSVVSGSALKRLIQATLFKAGEMAESFEYALERVCYVASKLEKLNNVQDAIELKDLTIQFKDGLLNDLKEMTEIITIQKNNELISQKSAIKELRNLDGESLDNEIADIQKETFSEPLSGEPGEV